MRAMIRWAGGANSATGSTGSDEVILLDRRLYRSMTGTETLTGVELDFGARGMIVVDG